MATSKEHGKEHLAMKTPPIVSQQEWEAARQQLLVKEKAFTRSRDALAAERRRMPWLPVQKKYGFEGPKGKMSLLDLFEGRRQLILYRAFFCPTCGHTSPACQPALNCSTKADVALRLICEDIGFYHIDFLDGWFFRVWGRGSSACPAAGTERQAAA